MANRAAFPLYPLYVHAHYNILQAYLVHYPLLSTFHSVHTHLPSNPSPWRRPWSYLMIGPCCSAPIPYPIPRIPPMLPQEKPFEMYQRHGELDLNAVTRVCYRGSHVKDAEEVGFVCLT